MTRRKTVLAGDLSLTSPAFSIIEVDKQNRSLRTIHVSSTKTDSKQPFGARLAKITNHLEDILKEHHIDYVCLEKGFSRFNKVTHSLQRVVGAVILTLYKYGLLKFTEIPPTTVKKQLTNNGKASKESVADSIHHYLPEAYYKNDDESDSLAVGISFFKKKGWVD